MNDSFLDNDIMVPTVSPPENWTRLRHTVRETYPQIVRLLSYNKNEKSVFNCEDIIPARQALEILMQATCEIYEEVRTMESAIIEKASWKQEVGYYEKREAQD
jgi:hypothetical protein